MYGTKLQGADFSSAQLQGANLNHAYLKGVNFRKARLQGAEFSGSQLQGANFMEAQLQGASFWNANLQGIDFSLANLGAWEMTEGELASLINSIPQDRKAREIFEKKIKKRLGKITLIKVSEDIKVRHSFVRAKKEQIQFMGIPSLSEKESVAFRKTIYRPLLCRHPVLIKENRDNKKYLFPRLSSPLSLEEVIDHASRNCPKFLPKKYRNLKSLAQKNLPSEEPSTGSSQSTK